MIDVQLKTTEPETVAYIAMRGAYDQMPEAMGRLYGWVAQHGMQPVGMPVGVYLTDPSLPGVDPVWELHAPVGGDIIDLPVDATCCGTKHVDPHLVAYAIHRGPYESVGATYGELATWIAANGWTAGRGVRVRPEDHGPAGLCHRDQVPDRQALSLRRTPQGFSAVRRSEPCRPNELAKGRFRVEPIIWDERLATGDPHIDAQHLELHDLVLELGMLAAAEPDRVRLGEVLFDILQYASTHFADEERLMERVGFPGLERQRRLHAAFGREMNDVARAFADGDENVTALEVQQMMYGWLLQHVWEEDLQFAEYVRPVGN